MTKRLQVQHDTGERKWGYSGENCQRCGSSQCDGKPCIEAIADQEQKWGEQRLPTNE